jgi:hypothetical protein
LRCPIVIGVKSALADNVGPRVKATPGELIIFNVCMAMGLIPVGLENVGSTRLTVLLYESVINNCLEEFTAIAEGE